MSKKKKEKERVTVAYWSDKFKRAMVHKSELTKEWKTYWDAYTGDYFLNDGRPEYKSDQVSNYIFSTIETIRPIMIDNDPRFEAVARTEDGNLVRDLVQNAINFEFDREDMNLKIPRQLITTLILGTSVWFIPWDGNAKDTFYEGEIRAIEVNPFNLFPAPMATCVEDAEYLIYASYKHVNVLKSEYPDKAKELEGDRVKYEELALGMNTTEKVDNQVLVLEIYARDYSTTEEEDGEDEEGNKIIKKKLNYPNGRVLTIAPELELLLEDKENPYKDGRFPFVLMKDYDIPFEFWGHGEPKQLLSPQTYINDLSNQVIDNIRLTANSPWILDKNSGIGKGTLTNRPGLIIRKNPGSEVRREFPPAMPKYVLDKIDDLKMEMETVSGVHDVTQGRRPTGIQAGNAIMALQEAGQARIRLKVKLMEYSLGNVATMWYNRMQQFWKVDRWINYSNSNGEVEHSLITEDILENDFTIQIKAGSTMSLNKAAMLDMLIRLSQTTAEDGLPMIDRATIMEYVDVADKQAIITKFEALREENMIQEEAMEAIEMTGANLDQAINEISGILDEIVAVVEGLGQDVAELQQFHINNENTKKEEAKKEEIENYNSEIAELENQRLSLGGEPMDSQMGEQPNLPPGAIGLIDGDMEIPQEILEAIMALSDEELMELLALVPNLEEVIANNLSGLA